MKIVAINGSARKGWNTHTLLIKTLEGAASAGAETELFNLYDLDYKGCIGCLGCKVRGSKDLGRCIVKDGLQPVLEAVHESDGFVLGSPIYLGDISGMMRAFWERLIFQYLNYDAYAKPYFNRKLHTAMIFTMNAPETLFDQVGYTEKFKGYETTLKTYFGHAVYMTASETLQVDDYSTYHLGQFNEAQRKERREQVFPLDCEAAYNLGVSLVK